MKVAIVGSRLFNDYKFFKTMLLKHLNDNDIIVSGGCPKGADKMAENFSKIEMKKNPIIYLPEYNKYGKYAAPKIRNRKIAEECDMMIAFLRGKSNGTKDAIKKAEELGKQVIIYELTI